MNIALTGSGGFLGNKLFRELRSTGVKVDTFSVRTKDDIEIFLEKLASYNYEHVINCAASLNPKTKLEHDLNALLPIRVQDSINKNVNRPNLIHISSINVLYEELADKYSASKREAESMLSLTNVMLVRPSLIISKQPEGTVKIFHDYLDRKLPIYPMIYPGNIYKPVDVNRLAEYIVNLIINRVTENNVLNIYGKDKLTTWDIFDQICEQKNKPNLKIDISFVNSILPSVLKRFFNKNRFLQQLLINDRSGTYPERGHNVFL